jgi:hypothetical protein
LPTFEILPPGAGGGSAKQRLEAFARAALVAMRVRASDSLDDMAKQVFDLAEAMMAESDKRIP